MPKYDDDECEACGEPLELDDEDRCVHCGARDGEAKDNEPSPRKVEAPKKQSAYRKWVVPVVFLAIIWWQQSQISELRSELSDAHSQAYQNEHEIRKLRELSHSHD